MLRKKKAVEMNPEPIQEVHEEKILDVTAAMTGTLAFKDPVNLRINGTFEGSLDTKGTLTVGENAVIKANIIGEIIVIAGRVTGDITASKSLEIVPPALVLGNISTPIIGIKSGAILEGRLRMTSGVRKEGKPAVEETSASKELSLEEVAIYLEVETNVVEDWAQKGRIPSRRRQDKWVFDKAQVDKWVADERVKI